MPKLSDLIEVTPRSIHGHHHRTVYDACIAGEVHPLATADSKELALQQAIEAVRAEVKYSLRREYMIARDGAVFCLYYSQGWMYDIVRQSNQRCPSSSLMGADLTFEQAREQMLAHFEQYNEQAG